MDIGLPHAKHSKFRIRMALAAFLLVMSCFVAVVRNRCSAKFELIIGKNSNRKENIEVLLENYGSLAPKRYKYSQLKDITRSFSEKLGEGGYGTGGFI
ncbi:hypothetical protein E2562_015435 [Oryza meyeriana var. granulata]|uniref:Uncharacterized protein n=1 Tax=Oryza meyeriana var. granulata TaxID=110450 RepID=A0A6G1BWQ0_9ORYZ|nr:hypothetical protein E2562_015435 [Oryza meyeriana var. granulata]